MSTVSLYIEHPWYIVIKISVNIYYFTQLTKLIFFDFTINYDDP